MDYFKQRRAYRNSKLMEIKVSNGQNNLYRELLDYANDQGYLDDWFSVKNDALESLTGLSEPGIRQARNQLIQMDLIEYQKGVKNTRAPKYKIIKLYDRSKSSVTKNANQYGNSMPDSTVKKASNDTDLANDNASSMPDSTQDVRQTVTQPISQTVTPVFTSTDSYLTDTTTTSSPSSVPKTQNDEPEEPHPIAFYQRIFNRPATAIQTPIIMDYADELGRPLVNHALMLAGEAGANFNYAKGIMDNWSKDGIKTVEQAKQASADFKNKKKSGNRVGRTPIKETLPDWAKTKQTEKRDATALTPEQEASLQKRLDKLSKGDETNV